MTIRWSQDMDNKVDEILGKGGSQIEAANATGVSVLAMKRRLVKRGKPLADLGWPGKDERGRVLLREIELFIKHFNLPPSTFSRRFTHDPRFVFDLRKGRGVRPATAERLRAAMAEWRKNHEIGSTQRGSDPVLG